MRESGGLWDKLRRFAPGLLLATEKSERLLNLAGALLEAAQPDNAPPDRELIQVAAWLIQWGFAKNPTDRRFIVPLLSLDQALKFLPPPARELATELNAGLEPPDDVEAWEDLRDCQDAAAVGRYLALKLEQPGQRIFWASQAVDWHLRRGEAEAALDVLDNVDWPGRSPLLRERLRADVACFLGSPEEARRLWQGLPSAVWGPLRGWMLARTAAQCGDADTARALLTAQRRLAPWHPATLLALSGMVRPPALDAQAAERVPAAILMFSWNKADLLAATLERLATTHLGQSSLTILDNGSTDATPQVLDRAASLFGERLEVVRLPVNIGAPAARNWLLSTERARSAEWAVFLDDDVLPPADWLDLLLSTADSAQGNIQAVGCRVVDATPPHCLQMTEINLDPPTPEAGVVIPDPGIGDLDLGLYDHVRPCLSVTGCCHALRVSAIEDIGVFDIRFSPTQFDDFERDLRAFAKGYRCVCDGRLGMPHVQNSSLRQASSPARRGQIQGNLVKLNAMYPPERMAEVVQENVDLLWSDLESRLAVVDGQ